MNITLGPEAEKLLKDQLERGGYASAEAVVLAALAALAEAERYGDFAPGELDELLAEGERSGEPLDGEQVLSELRRLGSKDAGSGTAG